MKKIILITMISLITNANLFSQTVNNIPFEEIDVEYVQIVGTSKLMSTKLNIDIDFGQENSVWTNKDTQLRDENGKKIVFNSMIDALNFMAKNGYEFLDANAFTHGGQNVYHFMLKRKNRENIVATNPDKSNQVN